MKRKMEVERMNDENNPFNLYMEEESKDDFKKAKQATNAFKQTWNEFTRKWRQIQEAYEQQGASDTAARDAMAAWIQKQTEGPMWYTEPNQENLRETEDENTREEIQKLKKQLTFWIERAQEGVIIGDGGICGVSSNNLSLVASGVREEPYPREYPRDDSDWMRCKRTIQRMEDPEWLIRILQKFPNKKGWRDFRADLIRTTINQLEQVYI